MSALNHKPGDAAKANTHRYTMSATGEAFHNSDKYIRAVMGPIGGGKTTMAVMELLMASMRQAPDPATKIRSVRWAVTRATYAEIENALLPTFREWVGWLNPDGWKKKTPIEWSARVPLADGTLLDLEVLFISVGTGEDAAMKFRGLELTGLFVSEYSTLSVPNFEIMSGRVGRWPARKLDEAGNVLVECTAPCIIMESNPPSRDSGWFHFFERSDNRHRRAIFRQPPAVLRVGDEWVPNPEADNFNNHSGGGARYYKHQLDAMRTEEQVRVYLCGEYGRSMIGSPVWPMFSEAEHVEQTSRLPDKRRITPDPNAALYIGMDFGLNSAAVFGQLDTTGRLIITDALHEPNCNTSVFINKHLLPLLKERYTLHAPMVFGDPTGVNREGNQGITAYSLLADAGLAAQPAPTNNISMRLGAVSEFLSETNGMLLSPHVHQLIDALNGEYTMVATKSGEITPSKGPASHIADALQYLCLSLRHQSKHDTSVNMQEVAAAERAARRIGRHAIGASF